MVTLYGGCLLLLGGVLMIGSFFNIELRSSVALPNAEINTPPNPSIG